MYYTMNLRFELLCRRKTKFGGCPISSPVINNQLVQLQAGKSVLTSLDS